MGANRNPNPYPYPSLSDDFITMMLLTLQYLVFIFKYTNTLHDNSCNITCMLSFKMLNWHNLHSTYTHPQKYSIFSLVISLKFDQILLRVGIYFGTRSSVYLFNELYQNRVDIMPWIQGQQATHDMGRK